MRSTAIDCQRCRWAVVLTTGLAAAASPPADADNFFWVGGEDTFWHNSENWAPQEIPGPGDDVFATAVENAPVLITLGFNTSPLKSLCLTGHDTSAMLVTNGQRLFVDSLDAGG